MDVLHAATTATIESTLVANGLDRDQIERAMKHLIGHDWRALPVSEWARRFRNNGLIGHRNAVLFIFDLEALIKNWIKVHELGRRQKGLANTSKNWKLTSPPQRDLI